ncbi:malate synthase A [Microscilla marina ATCC 23134]|uniref:Malate synthase n=2 Tax=Microscilla marina TaxID=1027 RepID=A2A085_MICM2|nr:malate synthase A [Microscilla marina ATCC 23134]
MFSLFFSLYNRKRKPFNTPMQETLIEGFKIKDEKIQKKYADILTPEAQAFLVKLHRTFEKRRQALLQEREQRQQKINQGEMPDFLAATQSVREGDWKAAEVPAEIQDRRTEITGPVDRKMIINALNSGAKVFMADFEDSNSPTLDNCLQGQVNLRDAINRKIDFVNEKGKAYKLKEKHAVLMVRPRGWHLVDKNVLIDGQPVSGGLMDFGLYFFHNIATLQAKGSGIYFYLPKLESHLEARLWNDAFVLAQQELKVPQGTIKATVLIETILAAFEMDEIIYELREHMAGLNAGRWDYIFSAIKKFIQYPDRIFPDRIQVGMTTHFMRSYAKLLVKTCHKRGVHAMGGMAAFIPSRKDEEVNKNAFAKVKADKELEAETGFDGTWVAHPDLVPVALEVFTKELGDQPNQKHETRSQEYNITAEDLLNFNIEGGKITEAGLRLNINVGILYIESWLNGVGAAALYNLMEDAATAEISRAQVWQWIHNDGVKLDDGREVNVKLYKEVLPSELDKIKAYVGEERYQKGQFELAIKLFDELVTNDQFEEFLTLEAYKHIS